MKINIITLGCSKNTVDSENIAGHLRKAGFDIFFDRKQNDCDIIIVNTCGFIGDAKEESINTLLEQVEIKQRGRKARKIIAVGCLIERYKKELKKEIPEIDAFFGVHEWDKLVASLISEYSGYFEKERTLSTPRHYAYLKISEGCNRACSYCAIPLIRGKHISRPIDELVAEAKEMVRSGVKEIIVIAQDTTYYGLDLYGKRRLGELLNRLAEESGAEWIRLHYTYPTSFPVDAIEAIRNHPNICNYIDIPLQHINSGILTSMQRGIDKKGTLDLLKKFREEIPNVSIRTTLIVGYPTETEADFEELKDFVREARFDRMGAFAYSPEEGTPAEKLGDPIPEEEKQRRLDELMAIQEQISLDKNEEKIGRTYKTIIDRKEGDLYIGRTEFDSPEVDDEVIINPTDIPLKKGEFYNVRITKAYENDLEGEIVL
ncbi:MAG: 30S ribosomal protein S12 methylthiotransferase RimO [Bacteroidales bacterium]|nr:30S ribosomal protein S12 methylthiotransferase RimO [Bacteroidales bacterium]